MIVVFAVEDVDLFVFFSSRRRHTRLQGDWSSDVCSSDLRPCSRPCVTGPIPVRAVDQQRRRVRYEAPATSRSEEHTSELQSPCNLVCRLLLEKKKCKTR